MELLKLQPLFLKHQKEIPAVTSQEGEAFELFFEILQKWNQEMALVSKTKIDKSFAIHFVDSLWILKFLEPYFNKDVFDIGTGAGFPGLVFAIRHPTKKITLFEKSGKKRDFLAEVVKQLKLQNVQIETIVPQSKLTGTFLARAVRPPEELVKWLKTTLKPSSILAINYGGSATPLTKVPGFRVLEEKRYDLPQDEGSRKIQIIERL